MSFLAISSLIADGRSALKQGNFWSALSLALMLPSICSRIEYNSEEFMGDSNTTFATNTKLYYYLKSNGVRKWADKKAYEDWCKSYVLGGNSYLHYALGSDVPAILYTLRCDLVHAGVADLYYNQKAIYLSCNDNGITELSSRLVISVSSLCEDIFRVAEKWVQDKGADTLKRTFVFNLFNADDKLLYTELCKDERAAFLKEELECFEAKRLDDH